MTNKDNNPDNQNRDGKGIVWIAIKQDSIDQMIAVIPQLYPVTFHTHVTLYYNVLRNQYEELINKSCIITITQYAYDQSIQACIVDLSKTGLTSQNIHPHITWSAKLDIPAVYSNTMLAKRDTYETSLVTAVNIQPLKIEGIVEFILFEDL